MPRLRTIQTNFASGELDPLMHFRPDTGAYRNGARSMRNCLLFATGGAATRPGTAHLATLTGPVRLLPFEFSASERYVLAFSNGRLDVYSTGGTLVTSVTTGCNWTTATLFRMTYAQVADTMILACQDWQPQIITRTGASTFIVEDVAFNRASNDELIYQPYFKFVADDVTLALSDTSGSVTMTASAGVFTADMVGQRIRWKQTEIEVTAYTNATTMTGTVQGTVKGELAPNPFKVAQGSTTVEVTHVAHGFDTGDTVVIAKAGDTGGVPSAELNGSHVIAVTSDDTYEFGVVTAATESIDGGGPGVEFSGTNLPTRDWTEPVFCDRNGWPGAVAFHEGRLWFGGSGGVPDGLWGSKIFQFLNFDVGEGDDDDSIQVTVGADDISNVRHLVSNGDLQIFTASGEFYAPSPREGSLTPGSITIRRQTPYGCAEVRPYPFDGATVFVQAAGTAVREFLYNEAAARYAATNLNILSGHVLSDPVDMAVLYGSTRRSEQYAFVVNADGTIAVLHSARSEELAGWTPWDMGGSGTPLVKSVCVVGETAYLAVDRHGSYRLEQLSDDWMDALDGRTAYTTGTATTSWTVDAIYYGREVAVNSGNYHLGTYTVGAAGELELDVAVTDIVVGYAFTFSIKTLPVDVQLDTGPTIGLPKRIARVWAGLDSTLALSISGNRLLLRQVTDDFSIEPAAVTGTYEFRLLGYQKDAFVEVTRAEPLPAVVLGMVMEVQL